MGQEPKSWLQPGGLTTAAGAALAFCGLLMAATTARAGDAERGRQLAAEHCTRCHVVGDINPRGGIESTPSFIGMKRLADWQRRYAEFYILPPHPALVRIKDVSAERDDSRPAFVQEIVLSLEDVESILAFARTLPDPAP